MSTPDLQGVLEGGVASVHELVVERLQPLVLELAGDVGLRGVRHVVAVEEFLDGEGVPVLGRCGVRERGDLSAVEAVEDAVDIAGELLLPPCGPSGRVLD